MKYLLLIGIIGTLLAKGFSLDREAFTFTEYHLEVRVEPEQQRLAVRGTITLRNDSSSPQKNAALQISSSLTWRSVQSEGKPLQFVSQPYESDIDHTGELSEAIVTLPEAVPPGGTVDLSIGYEGVIVLDATRLRRIGLPKETAVRTDWDQISKSFTAVRGVGYVAWYPVAMEAANLAEGNAVFETVGKWKRRHENSGMSVTFGATGVMRQDDIHFSATPILLTRVNLDLSDPAKYRAFSIARFNSDVPTFVLATYQTLSAKGLPLVEYQSDKDAAAACLDVLGKINSSVLVGRFGADLRVFESADPDAAPFATETIVLTPLKVPVARTTELMLAYALGREQVRSPRWWIRDGLGRYAEALYLRQKNGRGPAVAYLNSRLSILIEAEKGIGAGDHKGKEDSREDSALINSADEAYVQTKAMYVWWMLNDMLDDHLFDSLLSYEGASDRTPDYLQQVLESKTKRNLEWFFDDWVYHDRGLPDFRVESVYSHEAPQGNYLVTVTIENLGGAGAEVPVIVRFDNGETSERLEVRGKAKGVMRIRTPKPPTEVLVNDGSVPESDTTNNLFKVEGPAR